MSEPKTQSRRCRPPARWLAPLLVCSLLVACGGGSTTGDRAAIRSVLTSFFNALAHGDGRVACAHASPPGQQRIVATIGPELQNFGIYGCADVVYVTGAQMKPAGRRALETARIARITVNGTKATVALSALSSPNGSVAVELDTQAPIRLVDSYGVWLITSL